MRVPRLQEENITVEKRISTLRELSSDEEGKGSGAKEQEGGRDKWGYLSSHQKEVGPSGEHFSILSPDPHLRMTQQCDSKFVLSLGSRDISGSLPQWP